ncbi:MAG: hypothetical protein SGI94_13665 [Saprospiraceae bacterium]|nr:hypothetical protein [Saprospiraceae bacterium]
MEQKLHKLIAYSGEDLPQSLERKPPAYLKFSIIVFQASLVERFARIFESLFRKQVVILVLTLFAGLFPIAIWAYWNNLKQNFEFIPTSNLSWYVLLTVLSSLFHELGHASACRYYQVKHGGIGVGFYLFTPVMFADVTAAWLLPGKQRIVINVGGIYFEIIFSLLILCGVFLTGNFLFLSFGLLILFKMLYNLNPFFRTDGYWILSDALSIPNLRQKSNKKLKDLWNGLLREKGQKLSLKDWFLVFYSVISMAFIGAFLYYVLFVFEGSLIYFPYYLYDFFRDAVNNEIHTMASFFESLKAFIIPVFFYYLVVRILIVQIRRYGFFKRSSTP